ncbi:MULTISPECIES: DUF6082 family protein [unclassified Streptomyces]|uniref:DUF6082 family protein n=1 Tax=unclassified Streptomyces TaxID=2593676 RepID=UPI001BAE803F|nr:MULTISPECIES: DUF6082 family protein [unclassified Streptomyces]QUC55991.1 hypothetical protein IOD14_03840 [Streptomyces sp. A2-16]
MGLTVPKQEELLQELLQSLVQQLGRMADGYDRIATELHRANLIQLRGFFLERLDRAIDDPVLADSLSTGEFANLSDEERRQMLNANAQYGLILLAHQIGSIDRSALLGNLKILRRSPTFAEYWERTATARSCLAPESFEARVGRAIDAIMDERPEDLEEWWVVASGD